MKFLLVIAVIVLVLWLARAARRAPERTGAPKRPAALEDMVSCAHCGVHLPRSEALPGRGGLFCGAAHRAEHERLES